MKRPLARYISVSLAIPVLITGLFSAQGAGAQSDPALFDLVLNLPGDELPDVIPASTQINFGMGSVSIPGRVVADGPDIEVNVNSPVEHRDDYFKTQLALSNGATLNLIDGRLFYGLDSFLGHGGVFNMYGGYASYAAASGESHFFGGQAEVVVGRWGIVNVYEGSSVSIWPGGGTVNVRGGTLVRPSAYARDQTAGSTPVDYTVFEGEIVSLGGHGRLVMNGGRVSGGWGCILTKPGRAGRGLHDRWRNWTTL